MSNTATTRTGLRGYVSHHEFGGMKIPVNIQNLVLRDYCARNNRMFKLSMNEYFFAGCYIQLEGVLKQLPNVEGVVMCSIFMLPKNDARRSEILNAFVEQGAELHCIFESLVIKTKSDLERAEELFLMREAILQCPTGLELSLLPDIGSKDLFS